MAICFKFQDLCVGVNYIGSESKRICNLRWMLELEIKSKYRSPSFIDIIMIVSILQHFCLGMYTTTIHCNSKFPTFMYGVSCIHDYT
jgi:hypothetical protein